MIILTLNLNTAVHIRDYEMIGWPAWHDDRPNKRDCEMSNRLSLSTRRQQSALDMRSIIMYGIQRGARFARPAEQASVTALVSEPLESPFRTDLMSQNNSSILHRDTVFFCLKSSKARKAGKVGRNLVIQASVPSRIYCS